MNTSSYCRSPKIDADQIARNVQALTGGATLEIENLKSLSPLPIPPFGQAQTVSLIEALFQPAERIHIMWKRQKMVGGKVDEFFDGAGLSVTRQEMICSLQTETLVQKAGGYLYTINPVAKLASGKSGYFRDADCVAWRYLLLECDGVSMPEQAELLVRLPLPITAITSSGGRSLHAILQVDAEDEKAYKKLASGLLRKLKLVGFDPSCSNPSRKSRLPGFTRIDRETGLEGKQELLYLNNSPKAQAIA
jgi:hypothetical protein